MDYPLESYGLSDVGLQRSNNEDVFHALSAHNFFVLADGMGGHNAGEIAARELVLHLSASICRLSPLPIQKPSALSSLLYNAICDANTWVYKLSEQSPLLRGMGTTLCCLWIKNNFLLCGHVGDSRAYRLRKKLLKITEDHSIAMQQHKHALTRVIGTMPYVEPEIFLAPIHPGDTYLLCSDGLTKELSDNEILTILYDHPCVKTASQAMIDAAKAKGGGDNITVMMIKVHTHALHLSR